MNRDKEPAPRRDADKQSDSPLWLVCAWKIAAAPKPAKILATLAIFAALGITRLSYLQEEPGAPKDNPAPAVLPTEIIAPIPDPAYETVIADAAGIDVAVLVTPSAIEADPTPFSFNSDDGQSSSPNWILGIMGLALAIFGGKKLAAWMEKNGEDMRTIEDRLNKKKKPKDKDGPLP